MKIIISIFCPPLLSKGGCIKEPLSHILSKKQQPPKELEVTYHDKESMSLSWNADYGKPN